MCHFVVTQILTEEHSRLILEPQETDIASEEKEDEHPGTDIAKEKDELDTKSENNVSKSNELVQELPSEDGKDDTGAEPETAWPNLNEVNSSCVVLLAGTLYSYTVPTVHVLQYYSFVR